EMAACHEVPFGLYYGTIDATPLFVMLAARYFEQTRDLEHLRTLWPHIERALAWIDEYGDQDGDGFDEYCRKTSRGLANQGWKDSFDSVSHADGTLAQGAIALCEVQGYVYDAKRGAAKLARALGKVALAGKLLAEAETLRERFNDAFWCDDLGTYAIALDEGGAHALSGDGDARTGTSHRRDADGEGVLHGLGRADAVAARGAFQSDVVSQRLRLAARHRDHRRGLRPLRLSPPDLAAAARAVRCDARAR